MITFSLITTDRKWAARTGAFAADHNPSRNPNDRHVRYTVQLPDSALVSRDAKRVTVRLPDAPKDGATVMFAPVKWCESGKCACGYAGALAEVHAHILKTYGQSGNTHMWANAS